MKIYITLEYRIKTTTLLHKKMNLQKEYSRILLRIVSLTKISSFWIIDWKTGMSRTFMINGLSQRGLKVAKYSLTTIQIMSICAISFYKSAVHKI
jgi:hypothetical protein